MSMSDALIELAMIFVPGALLIWLDARRPARSE